MRLVHKKGKLQHVSIASQHEARTLSRRVVLVHGVVATIPTLESRAVSGNL